LPSLKRAGMVDAVVEFVSSASRLRLHIPRENCLCTAVASGLICPRSSRRVPNMPEEAGEPFGDEAYNYTREICMQRDVKFEADSIDRVGGVIGWIYLPAEVRITPPKKEKKSGAGVFSSANLSVILVARGYATVNGSPAVQRSAHYAELLKAETFASEHNMGMWSSEEFRASRQAETRSVDNEGVRDEGTNQTGKISSAIKSGLLSMADMKMALPSMTSELINSDVVKRAAASRLVSTE
uniref:TNase-like domain-containing protein n=1 Tax=Schistocephalus solidus TaxID=70667 RepID=A0A183SAI0_SCHSO